MAALFFSNVDDVCMSGNICIDISLEKIQVFFTT